MLFNLWYSTQTWRPPSFWTSITGDNRAVWLLNHSSSLHVSHHAFHICCCVKSESVWRLTNGPRFVGVNPILHPICVPIYHSCCKDVLKMAADSINKIQKDNIMTVVHDLYYPPDIIWVIKSGRMGCVGHVASVGEKRNTYMVLVGKP